MPDKKLTDNEIVKTLEECIELSFDDTEYTAVRLDTLTNALDLITRQQAKIEELVGNNDKLNIELQSMRSAANSLKMHYEEAQTEIEKLKENRDELWEIHCRDTERCLERIEEIDTLKKELKTAKSEAVKEFAERVKIRFAGTLSCNYGAIKQAIDKIAKETVGEDNA